MYTSNYELEVLLYIKKILEKMHENQKNIEEELRKINNKLYEKHISLLLD